MAEQGEPRITPLLFEVRPTAPQVTEQYADIALTGLFNVHAGQINSERQAIWQRYNIMFGANSILFAFLALGSRSKSELFVGALFGVMLCTAWWAITVSGWRLIRVRIEVALQFQWQGLNAVANPFEAGVYGRGIAGGMIYYVAISVIAFFILWHTLVLIYSLKP